MPLVSVHLLALSSKTSIPAFLNSIGAMIQPLVVARVQRWIITPEKLSKSKLLNTKWDLLIILPSSTSLPKANPWLENVADQWSITAGVPSSLVNDFHARNKRLLHPQKGDVPALTGSLDKPLKASSSQGLEASDELLEWSKTFLLGKGAVSMLNLLAFHEGKEAHDSYLQYGKAFASSIGAKRGGNAKIVGKVVPGQATENEDSSGWDEVALAHYPSIHHFVDMLASEDYQEVNHKYRLPALRDTCILCTVEVDAELTRGPARL